MLAHLYAHRFDRRERRARSRMWKVLVERFLQRHVPENAFVVDVAGGYGEFATYVRARRKIVLDANPDAHEHAAPGVEVRIADARRLEDQRDLVGAVDLVFVSNFFEHLDSADDFLAVLGGCRALLKTGGCLLVLQPNFRYCFREYYDFLDHSLPVTDRSMREALGASGFAIDELVPRFLPYTTKRRPSSPRLLEVYLKLPILWRIFGAQMFVRAHAIESRTEG
jgi:SAM-dependent methyltransferase